MALESKVLSIPDLATHLKQSRKNNEDAGDGWIDYSPNMSYLVLSLVIDTKPQEGAHWF